MGVHGLWELLAPVGRRVSVETLAGKKLAIDASIWMIQFMKAMRDERGEMVRNAHILGFFRRICKLLFLRTKPVFVFDGGTPALKRRTVIARRRQRENAQGKIRKTAEKLLLNHLKAMRLKELAKDLETQRKRNDVKGKKALVGEEPSSAQETGEGNDDAAMSLNQEQLDAMLAASLAAEENEGFHGDASTSGAGVAQDGVLEDDDDDEELIIPEMHGKIDPAILASLPPSMQLDLLVQMRERLMAENRQKYQKVKKAPASFSELQIQAYLKTVAFRREIDGVQKAAAGRGIGGVQTSRIASEANREFIFSSSFTGDKQAFTSVGQEETDASQSNPSPVTLNNNAAHKNSPAKSSGSAAGPTQPETSKAFNDDVGTYTDERGRLRVNRVRALGIRMTRDLQRNLDLMKEIEQEKTDANQTDSERPGSSNLVDGLVKSPEGILHQEVTHNINDNDGVDATEEPAIMKGTSIQVSFEDNCDHRSSNEDDDLFALLVAGEPVMDFSADTSNSPIQNLQSTSDCEWEEGVIEDKVEGHATQGVPSDEGEIEWEEGSPDSQRKITSNQDEKNENGDESEIEWDEEHQDTHSKSSYPDESRDTISRGALEEEAAVQEAIRRSLNDVTNNKCMNVVRENEEPEIAREKVSKLPLPVVEKMPDLETSLTDISQPVEPTPTTNILKTNDLKEMLHGSSDISNEESNLDLDVMSQDGGTAGNPAGEIPSPLDTLLEERLSPLPGTGRSRSKLVANSGVEVADNSNDSAGGYSVTNVLSGSLLNSGPSHSKDAYPAVLDDNSFQTESVDIAAEKQPPVEPSVVDVEENYEDMDTRLEEEMIYLDKERDELGNEQRKNERNAESVSSEMFVECQELLQMFGLPYIIAPMEAEAQCAFMELSNLVDGVVTDDSDAFLFGARSVYKNIFDDRKYVETYLMKDIENELGLDREKLIHMALLLGSDYTEGVSGIGIVNAIEVVNAFPEKDGLQEFREWIESPDPTILGKLDVEGGSSKKKMPKTGEAAMSSSSSNLDEISRDQSVRESLDEATRRRQFFMDTHRNVSKNWHIPSSFPSDAVISAYASPQVDKSTEPFAWGKPDLSVLRKLCWEKFSWATSKADDLLLPVLKEYNKHETQLRLEAFYTFNERFAKIKSKRVKKALKGIAGDKSSEVVDGMPRQSGKGKKRKGKPSENEAVESGVSSSGLNITDTSNQTNTSVKPAAKQSKGKQAKEKRQKVGLEASSNASDSPNSKKGTRGRGRGRGRGQGRGRGREENDLSSEDTETSHEKDGGLCDDVSEPHEIRRSRRARKTVNYNEFGEAEADREICVNKGSTANDSVGAGVVDAIQTAAGQLEEGKPIEPEVGLFAGENEQAYDTNMIDTIQSDLNLFEDHFDQDELAKDYLQSGGGFCAEEDEQNGDGTHPSSPSKEMIPEESSDHNSIENEIDQSVTAPIVNEKDQIEDDSLNDDDDDENESGTRFAGSLRAMPNLRKKRRRT